VLRTAFFAALFAFALTSSGVVAQTIDTTPIPMPPKPDLTPVTYFVGTWSCTFKSARRAVPQFTTTVTTLDPGGRWLVKKSHTKPAAYFPHPSDAIDMITYDPFAKRWVDVETDSLGGYDVSASSGWSGNTMVWKDLTFVAVRDVVSASQVTTKKVSASKFTSTSSFVTAKGKTVGTTTVCTKA